MTTIVMTTTIRVFIDFVSSGLITAMLQNQLLGLVERLTAGSFSHLSD